MDDFEIDEYELEVLRSSDTKDLLDEDILICECMCVSVGDIRKLFSNSQIVDLNRLREEFCMGQGCSSCLKTASQWQDKIF